MYKQAQNSLYDPFLTQIPMLSFDILVNYIELLDSTCVEFPHTHNDYEIYYSTEGILNVKLEKNTVSLLAGNFLLLPPGLQHGSIYEPNNPKKYLVMIFNFHDRAMNNSHKNSFPKFEDTFINTVNKSIIRNEYYFGKDINECKHLIPLIQKELETKGFGWQLMIRNYYLSFIVNVLRNIITSPISNEKDFNGLNKAIEITKFMHNNYHKNITLQDVANAMYMTPRHISRIFDEYFGTSFGRTLSIYRLNYAKNYLLDTNYSVEKIASLVGFSSAQTLFKLFKEREGITISKYRKKHCTPELKKEEL